VFGYFDQSFIYYGTLRAGLVSLVHWPHGLICVPPGRQSYGDIEYQGTWYVQNNSADHQFGCVFGYGSYSGYYAVQWTRNHKTVHYDETIKGVASVRGLHIKVDLF